LPLSCIMLLSTHESTWFRIFFFVFCGSLSARKNNVCYWNFLYRLPFCGRSLCFSFCRLLGASCGFSLCVTNFVGQECIWCVIVVVWLCRWCLLAHVISSISYASLIITVQWYEKWIMVWSASLPTMGSCDCMHGYKTVRILGCPFWKFVFVMYWNLLCATQQCLHAIQLVTRSAPVIVLHSIKISQHTHAHTWYSAGMYWFMINILNCISLLSCRILSNKSSFSTWNSALNSAIYKSKVWCGYTVKE